MIPAAMPAIAPLVNPWEALLVVPLVFEVDTGLEVVLAGEVIAIMSCA